MAANNSCRGLYTLDISCRAASRSTRMARMGGLRTGWQPSWFVSERLVCLCRFHRRRGSFADRLCRMAGSSANGGHQLEGSGNQVYRICRLRHRSGGHISGVHSKSRQSDGSAWRWRTFSSSPSVMGSISDDDDIRLLSLAESSAHSLCAAGGILLGVDLLPAT